MEPKTKIINYHILELKEMENLSERTKNVCLEGTLNTLYKILYYYLENGSFRGIRNCGNKTESELINLSKKYIKLTGLDMNNLQLTEPFIEFEEFKLFCYNKYGIPSVISEQYKEQYIRKSLRFFSFMEILIKYVLNEREQFIFQTNFRFYKNSQKQTLQTIGNRFNLTRERVRQISQQVPVKVFDSIAELAKRFLGFEKHICFYIDLKKDFVVITTDIANEINTAEKLNFTQKLYALVLSAIFQRYFVLLQDLEGIYSHYYLVNRKHKEVFDFKGFISEIQEQNSQRMANDLFLDSQTLLSKFVLPGQQINNRIRHICKRIAQEEFKVETVKNDFVFKRNSLIKLSEHIVDILTKSGAPMKLEEICKELKLRSRRLHPNIESLRSSILSIEEVVAIGKTSTYALKSWETIKTGTIKDLAKEYLEAHAEPMHISEITHYINKYRETSDKNILSNLKLDKTHSFSFFKLGYIGLIYKQYKNIEIEGGSKTRGRKPKT